MSAEERLEIHRIGGGTIENLRLKPREEDLSPPGISVLKATTPQDAARQLRDAFPGAVRLHQQAEQVGSTSIVQIRQAGFEIIHRPTSRFPNHYRITHPLGAAGFTDENLTHLAGVFATTICKML